MDRFQSLHSWNTLFVLLALTVLLSGCMRKTGEIVHTNASISNATEAADKQSDTNPCGTLRVQYPVFNVTGYLTARVKPNSSIYLFVSTDTSSDTAMYVIMHCPFLIEEPIYNQKYFKFYHLPPGDYVALVPREAFYETQGFPTTDGYDLPNSSIRLNICGGDVNHSFVSFSVLQEPTNLKTEK
jgi:hypothetical protein